MSFGNQRWRRIGTRRPKPGLFAKDERTKRHALVWRPPSFGLRPASMPCYGTAWSSQGANAKGEPTFHWGYRDSGAMSGRYWLLRHSVSVSSKDSEQP